MKCLVNLVTRELRYIMAQDRLIEKMKGYKVPLIHFRGTDSVGAPTHINTPFGFKIYSIQRAYEMGFRQIFWVDSSVYPVKDITPIFERLDKCGIFLEDSGHYVADWAEQKVLDYFGVKKDEAKKMRMLSAGFIGLDFAIEESSEFFARWSSSMQDGMFTGDTVKYRNEMCCASIIANQMGLDELFSKQHEYFAYVGEQYPMPTSAPFHLQGF